MFSTAQGGVRQLRLQPQRTSRMGPRDVRLSIANRASPGRHQSKQNQLVVLFLEDMAWLVKVPVPIYRESMYLQKPYYLEQPYAGMYINGA
jgi:hypothetical protein